MCTMGNILTGPLVLAVLVILVVHYLVFKWQPRYFAKLGVSGPFGWPFIGNLMPMFTKGMLQNDTTLMKKYGKVLGMFEGTQPVLLVSDPDLVQQILIKEFNVFSNRRPIPSGDDIVNHFLTSLAGDHWRHVRHLLVPTFSTGKLKKMTSDINDCAVILCENLIKEARAGNVVNVRDHAGGFTMDVMARTAFGVEVDTQKDPNSPFVRHAKALFTPTLRMAIVGLILIPISKTLVKKLKLSLFPPDTTNFFKQVVIKAIDERKKDQQENKTDFLQLMLNVQNDRVDNDKDAYGESETGEYHSESGSSWHNKGLSMQEILSQAVLFLLAGYDTTATTLGYLTYSLALNPEYQEKVYDEVRRVVGDQETIDFETANKLTYLDQCLHETLRLYPASIRTDREAVAETTLAGIPISKGQVFAIHIYAIHHDPNLWPEPEKFDPERFSPEAVATHHPMQYLPFSQGPRMCIGMRLALLEIKIAFAHLAKRFRFVQCPETEVPLTFEKWGLLQPKNGLKMKLELRN